jgi:hypothetical protein
VPAGLQVQAAGTYAVTFGFNTGVTSSFALAKNGVAVPGSAIFSALTPWVETHLIVTANATDVLSILNTGGGSALLVPPTGGVSASLVVEKIA